jgi:stress response protein YsnF
MAIHRNARIEDLDGNYGWLLRVNAKDEDHPLAVVRFANGATVEVPFELLHHHSDGGYALVGRWADFSRKTEEVAEIPVIAERVTVAVQPAPVKQVRVRRRVVSERQVVETPVWHERIEVDRVPVNAFVEQMPEPREEGDVLIIPCVEEVVVVEKRLRVREELRVRVVREQRIHREAVELRRHEIDIEHSEESQQSNPLKYRGDKS